MFHRCGTFLRDKPSLVTSICKLFVHKFRSRLFSPNSRVDSQSNEVRSRMTQISKYQRRAVPHPGHNATPLPSPPSPRLSPALLPQAPTKSRYPRPPPAVHLHFLLLAHPHYTLHAPPLSQARRRLPVPPGVGNERVGGREDEGSFAGTS